MAVQEYICKVATYQKLTPTVFQIGFCPEGEWSFNAGQFTSVVIEGKGPEGKNLRRAYSIASQPESKTIELCIKVVANGPGSNFLSEKRPGDSLRCFLAYGSFVYKTHPDRHVTMIATGTGVSPFRSILNSASFNANLPKSAQLLLGVREPDEVLYGDELSNRKTFEYLTFVSRPDSSYTGRKGRVTDFLKNADRSLWPETDFYLCGNGAMIDEVKSILTEHGVPKTAIHQEIYYKAATDEG